MTACAGRFFMALQPDPFTQTMYSTVVSGIPEDKMVFYNILAFFQNNTLFVVNIIGGYPVSSLRDLCAVRGGCTGIHLFYVGTALMKVPSFAYPEYR